MKFYYLLTSSFLCEPKISFITSKAGNSINFFQYGGSTLPPTSDFAVYINGQKTNQNYTSLTFNSDDCISIVLTNESSYYPYFKPNVNNTASSLDYIKEILEPLPLMKLNSTTEVIDFQHCFYCCSSLQKIPDKLFKNNPNANQFIATLAATGIKTIPENTFAFNPHIYTFNSCFYNCPNLESIPEKLFVNNLESTVFQYCFYVCPSLKTIPENLFANNTKAEYFGYCFCNCPSLQSIPERLFANNPKVIDFQHCFYQCISIKSVPENLFANNPNAVIFLAVLANTGISSIPEKLFANNTKANDFNSCFFNCPSLTTVPEKLFANNLEITIFNYVFYKCPSLTTLPENIFASNTKVTSFYYSLSDCPNLKNLTLKIGSKVVADCTNYATVASDSNITIKVPSGSTTQTKFNSWKGTNTRVKIVPY